MARKDRMRIAECHKGYGTYPVNLDADWECPYCRAAEDEAMKSALAIGLQQRAQMGFAVGCVAKPSPAQERELDVSPPRYKRQDPRWREAMDEAMRDLRREYEF